VPAKIVIKPSKDYVVKDNEKVAREKKSVDRANKAMIVSIISLVISLSVAGYVAWIKFGV